MICSGNKDTTLLRTPAHTRASEQQTKKKTNDDRKEEDETQSMMTNRKRNDDETIRATSVDPVCLLYVHKATVYLYKHSFIHV